MGRIVRKMNRNRSGRETGIIMTDLLTEILRIERVARATKKTSDFQQTRKEAREKEEEKGQRLAIVRGKQQQLAKEIERKGEEKIRQDKEQVFEVIFNLICKNLAEERERKELEERELIKKEEGENKREEKRV